MELKEMIKVMQHFADGGEIECTEIDFDEWIVVSHPCWNWAYYNYRIKEPKQKITIEKWLMQDPTDKEYSIIESSNVDKYKHYEKIKLIETYEVEL